MISQTSRATRISWATAYLFFTLAGIVAMFSPAQIVVATLVRVLVYTWASFLLLGGGSSLAGKVAGNWAGELIGLPLLSAANYVFGILLLVSGSTLAAIAIGGIFCGIGTAFIGRWIELRTVAKINQGVNSEL